MTVLVDPALPATQWFTAMKRPLPAPQEVELLVILMGGSMLTGVALFAFLQGVLFGVTALTLTSALMATAFWLDKRSVPPTRVVELPSTLLERYAMATSATQAVYIVGMKTNDSILQGEAIVLQAGLMPLLENLLHCATLQERADLDQRVGDETETTQELARCQGALDECITAYSAAAASADRLAALAQREALTLHQLSAPSLPAPLPQPQRSLEALTLREYTLKEYL